MQRKPLYDYDNSLSVSGLQSLTEPKLIKQLKDFIHSL